MKHQKALICAKLKNFTLNLLFFPEKPLEESTLAQLEAALFPQLSHCGETGQKEKSCRNSSKGKNIQSENDREAKFTKKEPIFFASTDHTTLTVCKNSLGPV